MKLQFMTVFLISKGLSFPLSLGYSVHVPVAAICLSLLIVAYHWDHFPASPMLSGMYSFVSLLLLIEFPPVTNSCIMQSAFMIME
jgi:hypothetical protein